MSESGSPSGQQGSATFDESTEYFDVKVSINQTALHAVIKNFQRQSARHEKTIATLVDDLRITKKDLESVQEKFMSLKRQVDGHERALRVTQQLADVSVSTTQFNTTIFKIKDDMSVFEDKLKLVEDLQSKAAANKMESVAAETIDKWYHETLTNDLQTREANLQQTIHDTVHGTLLTDLNKRLETKASMEKMLGLVDALRGEIVRVRKYAQDEAERTLKAIDQSEKQQQRRNDQAYNELEQRLSDAGRRISTLFDLMSLSEKECTAVTTAGVGTRSIDEVPTPTHGEGRLGSFSKLRQASSDLGSQRSSPKHEERGTPKYANGRDMPLDDDIDDKTALLMQSPVFLSFRHQLLKDIGERVQTTRTEQTSDFDIELLDIRNELRQRATPQRVIELIKQYSDTETPAKLMILQRRVQELDIDKVSHSYLNDALRGKADLHLLEAKADRQALAQADEAFKTHHIALQKQFDQFAKDRSEFQILREIVESASRGVPAGGEDSGSLLSTDVLNTAKTAVVEEDRTQLVQKKASASVLPYVALTPQPPGKTEKETAVEKVLKDSPEPTYLPSVQGLDRRATSAVQVNNDEERGNAASAEPPVRRDTSRQGRRLPQTVRPLTDHRDRERTVAVLSHNLKDSTAPPCSSVSVSPSRSPSQPQQTPAVAAIPQASSLKGAAGKVVTHQQQQQHGRLTNEAVVPMTASQKAYAQFVAEEQGVGSGRQSNSRSSGPAGGEEHHGGGDIPSYRDLKTRTFNKQYE